MRGRQEFPKEFKEEAVALLRRSGRSYRQVGADLGVNPSTLRGWYDSAMGKRRSSAGQAPPASAKPGLPPDGETLEQRLERLERENRQLRKQVTQLEEDRAILKKAAAFFAKESE